MWRRGTGTRPCASSLSKHPSFSRRDGDRPCGNGLVCCERNSSPSAVACLLVWRVPGRCQPHPGERPLEHAFEQFVVEADVTGQIFAAASIVHSTFPGIPDSRDLEKWAQALMPLVRQEQAFPSTEAKLDAYSSLFLAIFYGRPESPMLGVVLRAVLELLREPLDADQRTKAGSFLLAYCSATGDMAPGRDVISEISPLVERGDTSPARAAWWWIRVAYYRLQSGAYREALAAFDQSEAISRREGLQVTKTLISLWRVFALCHLGDLDRAEQIALRIGAELHPNSKEDVPHSHAARFYVAIHRGRLTEALDHGHEVVRLIDEIGMRWTRISTRVPLAFTLLECGLVEEAQKCADVIESLSRETCFSGYHCEVMLFDAYRAMRGGQVESFHTKLRDALVFGRAVSWMYPSAEAAARHPRAIREALRAGIEVDYVRGLVRKFARVHPRPTLNPGPGRSRFIPWDTSKSS